VIEAARSLVVGALGRFGLALERAPDLTRLVQDGYASLPELSARLAGLPGMIPVRRAAQLYLLAYAAPPGDIVEIGVWQGRVTCFLAQACADANNGVVHAIDTFRGNPGAEHGYVIAEQDLSDLERGFRQNIAAAGVNERVVLHPVSSAEAETAVRNQTAALRMLVIDGEHNYESVRSDLRYADLLVPGGVLVFDDYATHFPGVIAAAQEHIEAGAYADPVQLESTLVARKLPS